MIRVLLLSICTILLSSDFLNAQSAPSPKEHFGFNIGDNYRLATYSQTEEYFKKLAATSDRVKLVEMGKTEEGRSQYMVIVSSPSNLQNLAKYKEISQKLARAEDLTDDQAKALAQGGKAVVWIDGGLHATETVGAHQLIETMWNFVSRNDAETKKILDEVIILFVHANPDGQELVSNWYMRHEDTLKRSLSHLPKLYQKYIGHDNNRDFYMMNMKETQNMSRQLYIEWMPQILYNHHQSGPPGSVVAGPPYRDPFNFVYDPILITSLDGVGAAMNSRLTVEGKPGYTSKSGSVFSTWWNGGLRTTAYFHNIIGLLTEIIGNPTPSRVPLVTSRLIPNNATPSPVTPQQWLFRQSIDYSVSLNYAVLDHAVRHREQLLYNIYKMGKNSIDAGNTDHWTLSPAKVEAVNVAMRNDARLRGNVSNESRDSVTMKYFNQVFKDPKQRDARGYIISAEQPDFPTAVKFVNALIQSGIKVHKSTSAFNVNGKAYPLGSYVIKTNQAFRPHVIDMFEPQDHPNDFLYPGGPPVRPYDAAGWTPAYSMGIKFDRIAESFDGPFQPLAYGELQTPVTNNKINRQAAGYILDSRMNHSYAAVNELIKNGAEVYRITGPNGINQKVGEGSFFVPSSAKASDWLNKNANGLGLNLVSANRRPAQLSKVSKLRIGLWDTYGGSMPSGWLRWIFEQHNYDYKVIYANEINAGKLKEKYDVIVFVGGAIPSTTASPRSGI
ncbi:MAG: M14 family metallopeptidase, partial [Flavitalea sp.]